LCKMSSLAKAPFRTLCPALTTLEQRVGNGAAAAGRPREMDVHSSAQRSFNMSRIRRRDTEPELSVRSALLCMGFRYRLDVKQLPGCPDIVMPKYRIALFVLHGCFWHSHNCKSGQVRPKTNEEFWAAKRARTIQRDSESSKALAESGWRVVSLWECEINRAASNGELQDFLLSRLTTERGVASILLNSLINAACDCTSGHPSSEQDINGVLAAVHWIRVNDEIEAMLAVQMVATHFAATRALHRLKGIGHGRTRHPTCTTGCS
jgi:DNA mismatch endonuclease (patch repair protein)